MAVLNILTGILILESEKLSHYAKIRKLRAMDFISRSL